jgi:hypothetical protein
MREHQSKTGATRLRKTGMASMQGNLIQPHNQGLMACAFSR